MEEGDKSSGHGLGRVYAILVLGVQRDFLVRVIACMNEEADLRCTFGGSDRFGLRFLLLLISGKYLRLAIQVPGIPLGDTQLIDSWIMGSCHG